MRILKYLSITAGILLATTLMAAAYFIVPIWSKLPSGAELRHLSETVDVRLDEMPDHVHQALLAAENSDYLTNGTKALWCIKATLTSDTWGNCRAIIPILAFSEIIRQVPRTHNQTNYAIRRFIMVVKVEYYLTPEQILELALNQTYFGRNTYGITQAAQLYFAKAPENLTLAESALLAGQIRAPTRYSPISQPERALSRRNDVLELMVKYEFITPAQSGIAMVTPLGVAP